MINIKDVVASYEIDKKVLNKISLKISEGESVGIVGANGMGKSSLLSLIVGLLIPESGDIEINNVKLTKKNIREIRTKVGMLFQNPTDQLFMAEVIDDVSFGLRNMGIGEEEIKEKVDKVFMSLGREDLILKSTYKLSGGEQRTVALAGILVMEPQILLMDEPTSFLDPKARRNLINILKTIGKTKLIVTHDLDMALELCSRVVIMYKGNIVADGSAREILSDEELLKKYDLELPLGLQGIKYYEK